MTNLDNIFGLFSYSDDLPTGKTSYEDLKSSPIYYIGMYKKLILNHINFNKKVIVAPKIKKRAILTKITLILI